MHRWRNDRGSPRRTVPRRRLRARGAGRTAISPRPVEIAREWDRLVSWELLPKYVSNRPPLRHYGRKSSPKEETSMPAGRHFLQIPGPTNVPDRVLRAIDRPTIDHRGPEFAALGKEVLAGLRKVFRTSQPVVIFPASGTGAWEAALANTLSPGDRVLM